METTNKLHENCSTLETFFSAFGCRNGLIRMESSISTAIFHTDIYAHKLLRPPLQFEPPASHPTLIIIHRRVYSFASLLLLPPALFLTKLGTLIRVLSLVLLWNSQGKNEYVSTKLQGLIFSCSIQQNAQSHLWCILNFNNPVRFEVSLFYHPLYSLSLICNLRENWVQPIIAMMEDLSSFARGFSLYILEVLHVKIKTISFWLCKLFIILLYFNLDLTKFS